MATGGSTYYELLGVGPDATADQIKAGWRTTMKRVHPDIGGSGAGTIVAQFAYETLSDPVARRVYDESLVIRTSPSSTAAAPPRPPERDVLHDFDVWRRGHPGGTVADWAAESYRAIGIDICRGRTLKGEQCLARVKRGTDYCVHHRPAGTPGATASSKSRQRPCAALKKGGKPCGGMAYGDGVYCYMHQWPEYRYGTQQPASQPSGPSSYAPPSGRPKSPPTATSASPPAGGWKFTSWSRPQPSNKDGTRPEPRSQPAPATGHEVPAAASAKSTIAALAICAAIVLVVGVVWLNWGTITHALVVAARWTLGVLIVIGVLTIAAKRRR